jgi:putative ABC transport system permease protein
VTSSSIQVSLGDVAATLALVGVAAAVSLWRRADLEEDIAVAVVRSFVQLTAIGYVITFIFDQNSLWFVIALIAVMVVFGAVQARARAKRVPDAFWPLFLALALAAAATLGLVVALGVFKPQPRYLVPVGGMVVGNSMTAAAVALNRLGDEVSAHARELEATLALGATSTQAAAPLVRRSLRSGMITLIDSTKTTGLVFFPGTMVGMLLAGADPTAAVRLQLILLWTLLGSVALAGLIAITLAYRNFFTPAHQLREQPEP